MTDQAPGALRFLVDEDEGAHVRALEEWIRAAGEIGGNPVSGTFARLSLPGS